MIEPIGFVTAGGADSLDGIRARHIVRSLDGKAHGLRRLFKVAAHGFGLLRKLGRLRQDDLLLLCRGRLVANVGLHFVEGALMRRDQIGHDGDQSASIRQNNGTKRDLGFVKGTHRVHQLFRKPDAGNWLVRLRIVDVNQGSSNRLRRLFRMRRILAKAGDGFIGQRLHHLARRLFL